MRRDLVLLDEIVQAAERIMDLLDDVLAEDLELDDLRREAALWNFTRSADMAILVAPAENDLPRFARRVPELRAEQ